MLQVVLVEARNLPVWGLPWQSNPWCTLRLGGQVLRSRRDDDTSRASSHRAPVWNQEFQLLVMDPSEQVGGLWLLKAACGLLCDRINQEFQLLVWTPSSRSWLLGSCISTTL